MNTVYVIAGLVAAVVLYDVVVFYIQRKSPNDRFYTISQTMLKLYQRHPVFGVGVALGVGALIGHLFYSNSVGGCVTIGACLVAGLVIGHLLFPQS